MKRVTILALMVALLLVAGGAVALAYGSLGDSFEAKYGISVDCQYCHGAAMSLNSYGADMKANGNDLAAIESLDSDGDGVTNLAEINAGTLPHDASSKPAAGGSGGTTSPAATGTFSDMKGHWAMETVEDMNRKGIINGLPNGTFGPSNAMTRAQFAALALRVSGLPAVEPVLPTFSDVVPGAWYYGAVEAGLRAGFVSPGDSFSPDTGVTREDAAVMLVKALGFGPDAAALKVTQISGLLDFSDASAISERALVAIAVREGIITGYDNGTLLPGKVLNRAEAAVIISRGLAAKLDWKVTSGNSNYPVGPEACATCHSERYTDWQGTAHAKMIQDPNDENLVLYANFDTNPLFKLEEVDFVMGQLEGQRFIQKGEDGYYYYMPLSWNMEEKEWVPASGAWNKGYACAMCHTTGYNGTDRTFVAMGITCENCHGDGAKHVASGGDATAISADYSNDACNTCHGGMTRQGGQLESMGHTTFFAEKVDGEGYYGSSCMECHSATVYLAEEYGNHAPTLDDFRTGVYQKDRIGITCAVCHDSHKLEHEAQLRKDKLETCIQCHTAELAEGETLHAGHVHHPQKEMFLGYGGYDAEGNNLEVAQPKVTDCTNCHMTQGNHFFKVGDPYVGLEGHHGIEEHNSCASCHATMTEEGMAEALAGFETMALEVKALIDQVDADALDTESHELYEKAVANYEFYVADKSKGMHNTAHAKALLEAAKTILTGILGE